MFNDLFTHSIHRYERSNKNAESDEANYSKPIRRGVNKEAINNASRTQADGKYVSTKRYSCLTYKISNKNNNNIIIIIIIRDLILTLYSKRRAYCRISKLDFCGVDRT